MEDFWQQFSGITIFGFAVIGFAVYFLISGLWQWWMQGLSEHWPRAAGRILTSSIKDDSDSDTEKFKLKLRYEYNVGGKIYHGRWVVFGGSPTIEPGERQAAAEIYIEGTEVDVYYHPGFPRLAVLEREAPHAYSRMFFGGAIFAFILLAHWGTQAGWWPD